MFIYSKKGQVFPLLIAIASVLIITALITANLGKVSISRVGCINGADAGASAGVSDFACGYNKISLNHKITTVIYWVLFAITLPPIMVWCFPARHVVYALAKYFNNILYNGSKTIIAGYSDDVRKDAYYFAFINAGIDDPYKEDGRRYPADGEDWGAWTSIKAAFNAWWNGFPDNWETANSLTYTWRDGSQSVTVRCTSSAPRPLKNKSGIIIGLYFGVIPCLPMIPVPLPHGMMVRGFEDPRQRTVDVRVTRNYAEPQKSLGFWNVFQQSSTALARTSMTGGYWEGFDYTLR